MRAGRKPSLACGARHEAMVYAHEWMLKNIALYKKLGYQETHRAPEDGLARVFMRKVLPCMP